MHRDDFEILVDEALAELPDWVVEVVDNLHIEVVDRPPADVDPTGRRLLGLYEGVPLVDRGMGYFGVAPDRILIFRLPHLALGLDDGALRVQVRRTVLHEVAHHLGIDDDRLDELGWG